MLTELLSLTHWASGFWHFWPRKLSGLQKKCLGATRRPIYTSYFRGNSIFSCRFSLQLIHWVWIFAITSDHRSHNTQCTAMRHGADFPCCSRAAQPLEEHLEATGTLWILASLAPLIPTLLRKLWGIWSDWIFWDWPKTDGQDPHLSDWRYLRIIYCTELYWVMHLDSRYFQILGWQFLDHKPLSNIALPP